MHRRNFLKIAAVSLGAVLFRNKAGEQNAPPAPTLPAPKAAPLCVCAVAGFQYHQGPRILPRLRSGQPLALRREPDNPHDERAIAVHTEDGAKLGYVPRVINEIPANLLDRGHVLAVTVQKVNRHAPPWEAVIMELVLKG